MLERYFLTGLRLKWIPPKDAASSTDGAMIDNPPIVTNPMVYDGMDGNLVGGIHPSTVGLTKGMNIPYRWLAYAPGRIARIPLGGGDILTGRMSGCPITTWQSGGAPYAGHVGTIDNNPVVSRVVRHSYAAEMGSCTNLVGFNPAAAWSPGEIAQKAAALRVQSSFAIYALVTGPGNFYSILIFTITQMGSGNVGGKLFECCVGGIKSVPAMNSVAMRAWLMA